LRDAKEKPDQAADKTARAGAQHRYAVDSRDTIILFNALHADAFDGIRPKQNKEIFYHKNKGEKEDHPDQIGPRLVWNPG
jgi:hypothetical protein